MLRGLLLGKRCLWHASKYVISLLNSLPFEKGHAEIHMLCLSQSWIHKNHGSETKGCKPGAVTAPHIKCKGFVISDSSTRLLYCTCSLGQWFLSYKYLQILKKGRCLSPAPKMRRVSGILHFFMLLKYKSVFGYALNFCLVHWLISSDESI